MSFYRKYKFLIWLFVVALTVRLVILAIVNPLPIFNFLDSQSYDQIGWQLAKSWKEGTNLDIMEETSHIQIGYYYFVAAIYYFFGHRELIVNIFNIFFGTFAAILIYFLTRELFLEKAAKIAAILAMFWPSIMFWSTRNLKDALLLFLMAVIILFFVKLIRRFQFVYLVGLVVSAIFLLTMRAYTFLFFIGSLGLSYLLIGFRRFDCRIIITASLIVVFLIVSIIILSQFKNLQWNYLAKINLETIDFIRKSTLVGGSSFGQNVEYKSIIDIVKFLPTGLVYFVFSPFPWQKGSKLFKIAIPETILWYFILVFAVWGIIITWRKRKYEAWGLILFLILMTVSFAIFQGNIGSLFRQRAQVWFFGFIFVAMGIVEFLNSRNEKLKRIFDVLVSIVGLILLSPLFLITSLAVLIDDGRPIFYFSERVGKGGKKFKMIKFRTMKVNRQDIKEFEYTPENDPRVTKAGVWIRRFSIDELPQLFNILKGEMSLVGPRPTFPFRMVNIPAHWRRLEVRPGLTGWQQINGRNSLDWERMMELDNWYIDNRSFGVDLYIIIKTFMVVFTGQGLYATENTYKDVAKSFKEYIEKSEQNL